MHPRQSCRARHLDWRPDKPDQRDKVFAHHFPLAVASLPPKVDLRPKCPPIWDQGDLGCCTGFGNAAVLAFIHEDQEFSQLFIYYFERVIEGTVRQDNGAEIRDGQKVLNKYGAPPVALWPYNIRSFKTKPSKKAIQAALAFKTSNYYRLTTGDEFRQCLADGFPIVFGFTCYEHLESRAAASTGLLPVPGPKEKTVGGHCVVLVGYGVASDFVSADACAQGGMQPSDPVYLVRNSWGTDWGISGYFLMAAGYVENDNLSTDFWTVRA
jgi:C1A family cysteine protease